MTHDQHLCTTGWVGYELLDSGEGLKLERFGSVTLIRPEIQALWKKARPELWDSAHAVFSFHEQKGSWNVRKPLPDPWELSWEHVRFTAALTSFKHIGVFPEQAPNWEWLSARVADSRRVRLTFHEGEPDSPAPKVLNLFGYTGIASIVAAQSGAKVTHVDSSKQSLDWANANAHLSGIGEDRIRWILDDALAFAKREMRRGACYDGIILDPPSFGRGAKGEVWRIEGGLLALLDCVHSLLSDKSGAFFLLNGYAAGYAPRSFAQAVESAFPSADLETHEESGELYIKESSSERVIPSGIYVRFMR